MLRSMVWGFFLPIFLLLLEHNRQLSDWTEDYLYTANEDIIVDILEKRKTAFIEVLMIILKSKGVSDTCTHELAFPYLFEHLSKIQIDRPIN